MSRAKWCNTADTFIRNRPDPLSTNSNKTVKGEYELSKKSKMPKKRSQYTPLPFTAVFSEPVQEAVPSLPYQSVALEDFEVWRGQLEQEGYTVLAGVAGEQEVEEARKLLWGWL